MTVNPSMTLRSTAALVFICGAALASLNAQEAPSERSEAGEFQKLDPALLFLQGGPGDATNPWGYAGFRNWLKYFTVVQWDQRGAGRTLGRNGASAASTITIERMVQDGVELTELLSKRLQKDKIVLVGHSWGSILGVL